MGGVHSGGMGGRPSGGVWKDTGTGSEVTIHVRLPYCVVQRKDTTIRGLHRVYFSPATTLCPKSLQGVALTGRNSTGPLFRPMMSYVAYALRYRRRRQKTDACDHY